MRADSENKHRIVRLDLQLGSTCLVQEHQRTRGKWDPAFATLRLKFGVNLHVHTLTELKQRASGCRCLFLLSLLLIEARHRWIRV
jgi:hypothetical protein